MTRDAGRGIKALTDAVNAIAAKVDLPLDLAADLLKAVDRVAAERAAKAAATARERCIQLAEDVSAVYQKRTVTPVNTIPPTSDVTVTTEDFADRLRQDGAP